VAAVRGGTITTYQPLSPTALQQPFIAEDPWARVRQEKMILGLMIGLVTMASSVWAYFMRKKPLIVTLAGGFWIVIGSAWLLRGNSVGLGFLLPKSHISLFQLGPCCHTLPG